MATFGYLRVSTLKQDVEAQRLGVLDYANSRKMGRVTLVEDSASGRVPWRERGIGKVLEQAKKGDAIVVSEVSRLARVTLQVLEIVELAVRKGVALHVVKGGIAFDGSLMSKVTLTVLGLAAEIERDLIAARTCEGLKKARANGKHIGRPRGTAEVLKLDERRADLETMVKAGVSVAAMSRLTGVCRATVDRWVKRRGVA